MTETFDPQAYLEDCVRIDDMVLDEEFIRVPSDLAFWSARHAEAVRTHLIAKLEAEKARAKAHLKLKAEAEIAGKKMTVADLDAHIYHDPDYLDAAVALIEAESEKKRLQGCVEAVHAKKEMVQSLGAKLRAEMERDPLVKAEQRNR
jgi:hypothetical protein